MLMPTFLGARINVKTLNVKFYVCYITMSSIT